jgi:6,7-dimethyl-8-ribityllumazine synthase
MLKKGSKKFSGVRRVQGNYSARRRRFTIIVSRFNEYLTTQLLRGALDTLIRHGAQEKNIHVVHVPGAFEIPLIAKKVALKKKTDAVIALAVIIRGQTKHFEQVATQTARGLREVALQSEVPVILGIIPAESVSDAIERVGLKQTNKGREWALAAIEMSNLMKQKFLRSAG